MASTVSVSIITPCYNGARFLAKTIESALNQSRPPLEILVVDDGSTDESAAIAKRFGPPVRVLSQPNQGESLARNHGLREAQGSHVLFLDADDLLAPESLERLVAAVGNGTRGVALMRCAWFTTDSSELHPRDPVQAKSFYPSIIESNFGPPHCWLTPISLIREAGEFEGAMRWFEDWDLWWRVGLTEATLEKSDYLGALYRQHSGSQLAGTSMTNRTRGHAALMTRMANAMLSRPESVELHGEPLFWNAWTALNRATAHGVPSHELLELRRCLRTLARRGPLSLRRGRTARVVSLLGARAAIALTRAAAHTKELSSDRRAGLSSTDVPHPSENRSAEAPLERSSCREQRATQETKVR